MNMSETITQLAISLVQFNTKVTKIDKDASNPFFKSKYATLDNIIDEVRPLLTSEGIAIMQIPGGDGENVTMKTLLIHESGEWIESDVLVMRPAKNDPQGVGSCISYARRYSLAAILSLNTGEDDDANAATFPSGNKQPDNKPSQTQTQEPPKTTQTQQTPPTSQTGTSDKLVSVGQAKMLYAKFKASTFEEMYRINDKLGYSIEKFEEVKMKDINSLISFLDENKLLV